MPLTEEIKKTIKDALNEALSDFNSAYLGVIEENAHGVNGDSGKLESYILIECAEDYDIEEYINDWERRIYDVIVRDMYLPFYPVVESEHDGDAYRIIIGYCIDTKKIPFALSLNHVIECENRHNSCAR